MRLDCGCDTLTNHKCRLHDWDWTTTTCPSCGYDRALRHKYTRKRVYCEACGLKT